MEETICHPATSYFGDDNLFCTSTTLEVTNIVNVQHALHFANSNKEAFFTNGLSGKEGDRGSSGVSIPHLLLNADTFPLIASKALEFIGSKLDLWTKVRSCAVLKEVCNCCVVCSQRNETSALMDG